MRNTFFQTLCNILQLGRNIFRLWWSYMGIMQLNLASLLKEAETEKPEIIHASCRSYVLWRTHTQCSKHLPPAATHYTYFMSSTPSTTSSEGLNTWYHTLNPGTCPPKPIVGSGPPQTASCSTAPLYFLMLFPATNYLAWMICRDIASELQRRDEERFFSDEKVRSKPSVGILKFKHDFFYWRLCFLTQSLFSGILAWAGRKACTFFTPPILYGWGYRPLLLLLLFLLLWQFRNSFDISLLLFWFWPN